MSIDGEVIDSWNEVLSVLGELEERLEQKDWLAVSELSKKLDENFRGFFTSYTALTADEGVVIAQNKERIVTTLNKVRLEAQKQKTVICEEAASLSKSQRGIAAYKKV